MHTVHMCIRGSSVICQPSRNATTIPLLAGHPLRGWPARLRGHKGSELGPAVWPKRASVAPPWRSASGHFDQAGSSRLAEARECGAALAISE